MKPHPIPSPLWTALPQAAALLASCAASPPATRKVRVIGLSTYYADQYVGQRVRRLNAIHNAECERLLKLADRSGNYDAYTATTAYSVQDAISDAIFFAAVARSAAHDRAAVDQSRMRVA